MRQPQAGRPLWLSVLLILGTVGAGLMLRLGHFGLPFLLVKYGGSALWALMIFWIVSTVRSRWPAVHAALAAGAIATAVELFKLHHHPALDAFRLTLPGTLLLGRIFSLWDLLAYAVGIATGTLADRAIRSRD